MAAIVGIPWENQDYNPAGVPGQALPQPANVFSPQFVPSGASYTWINNAGSLPRTNPSGDNVGIVVDLARTFGFICRDLRIHDPNSAQIQSRQLVHLIRSVTEQYILPVYSKIPLLIGGNIPQSATDLLTYIQVIHDTLPIATPPGQVTNWVTTKSHLELLLEIFILQYPNGWNDLRGRMFVANDNDPVNLPPALGRPPSAPRTGYLTLERGMPANARHSSSPTVLSITEGPPPPAPGNGRVLVGASLPKCGNCPELRDWAYAARMQRFEQVPHQNIVQAITSRNNPANNILATLNAATALPVAARAGAIANFQQAVVTYKGNGNNQDFFYHNHNAISYNSSDLRRRTFCWSCWTLYRFIANEPANVIRWAELPNYETADIHVGNIAANPLVQIRGNCAEAIIHGQCGRWGAHGLLAFAQNGGVMNAQGNWVPNQPLPPTPPPH